MATPIKATPDASPRILKWAMYLGGGYALAAVIFGWTPYRWALRVFTWGGVIHVEIARIIFAAVCLLGSVVIATVVMRLSSEATPDKTVEPFGLTAHPRPPAGTGRKWQRFVPRSKWAGGIAIFGAAFLAGAVVDVMRGAGSSLPSFDITADSLARVPRHVYVKIRLGPVRVLAAPRICDSNHCYLPIVSDDQLVDPKAIALLAVPRFGSTDGRSLTPESAGIVVPGMLSRELEAWAFDHAIIRPDYLVIDPSETDESVRSTPEGSRKLGVGLLGLAAFLECLARLWYWARSRAGWLLPW